jgi:hypothetical protein
MKHFQDFTEFFDSLPSAALSEAYAHTAGNYTEGYGFEAYNQKVQYAIPASDVSIGSATIPAGDVVYRLESAAYSYEEARDGQKWRIPLDEANPGVAASYEYGALSKKEFEERFEDWEQHNSVSRATTSWVAAQTRNSGPGEWEK